MILRLVRAEMLEVMRADYIKFARARGLAERTIYFVHALRNTLVPVITVIGLNRLKIVADYKRITQQRGSFRVVIMVLAMAVTVVLPVLAVLRM